MATWQEVVAWIVEADPQASIPDSVEEVFHVASIESADPGSAIFAMNEDSLHQGLASAATLILTLPALAASVHDMRVLPVRDPRLAFSLLAARLVPPVRGEVHPTAVLHPSARIADSVCIGAGSVVAAGVVIGEFSKIGARVVLEKGTVLGSRVQVQSGAVLGSYGFGYARRPDRSYVLFPQQGVLVVEDDVEIGANSTIDRGALGETRIGAGTKIDNLVHVGHNCRIGRNVILAAQTGISGSTVIEDGAILGGQVGVGEHATVGPDVILGGGAGVLSGKKLRGPGEVFWGRPAQPLKQYLRDLARLRRGR